MCVFYILLFLLFYNLLGIFLLIKSIRLVVSILPFVFFFFAIILIQFIAMLFHRMGTISHILASTELQWCKSKDEFLSDEALIEKNAVEIVKQMQKLRGIDGDGHYGDR